MVDLVDSTHKIWIEVEECGIDPVTDREEYNHHITEPLEGGEYILELDDAVFVQSLLQEVGQSATESLPYIKNPSLCPECASDQIEGESIEVASGGAHQIVGCGDCDARWVDSYILAGHILLEEGHASS